MNRREFIKSGMAALATLWCVKVTEESVVAEIVPEQEIKTEWVEDGCDNCTRYFCDPDCPHYQGASPYFVVYPTWK